MSDTMPEVDEEGFLVDAEKWTQDIAKILAEAELPKGLTRDHWVIIDFLREYYFNFETVPPVRMLARRTGFTLRRIKELFPSGITKGACRIAGIPRIVIKPQFLYP
jgi:tRNA 2-thiouridine synthesizing protein E